MDPHQRLFSRLNRFIRLVSAVSAMLDLRFIVIWRIGCGVVSLRAAHAVSSGFIVVATLTVGWAKLIPAGNK
jgi:hypothetical protein